MSAQPESAAHNSTVQKLTPPQETRPTTWSETQSALLGTATKCTLDGAPLRSVSDGEKAPDSFDTPIDELKESIQSCVDEFLARPSPWAKKELVVNLAALKGGGIFIDPARVSEKSAAGLKAEGAQELICFFEDVIPSAEDAEVTVEKMQAVVVVYLKKMNHPSTTGRTIESLAKAARMSVPTFNKLAASFDEAAGVANVPFHRAPTSARRTEGMIAWWKTNRRKTGRRAGRPLVWTAQDVKRFASGGPPLRRRELARRLEENGIPHTSAYRLIRECVKSGELVTLSHRRVIWRPDEKATVPPPAEKLA